MKKRILFVLMTVLFLSVSNFLQGAITVTTPNGGETWFPGSAYDITWFSSETVGNFKIEFSPDNGSNWTEITAATENDGIYNWT
ncbi:MAG TPA: hypothetical protein VK469_02355, partial [Candidatus Kapabacteria bacterium]|nr:hypothetical protein [Candidatus Kapabacteria bacterium]